MATTRSEGNLKNRSGEISITFDRVLNAETDLGISDGDNPLGFDASSLDDQATLIQFEPGTYPIPDGEALSLNDNQTFGIESTTQDKNDVTFRCATDSAQADIFQSGNTSFAQNMFIGDITFDSRSNYNGPAEITLFVGGALDSLILTGSQMVGWCAKEAYFIGDITQTAATGFEFIIRDFIDERSKEIGAYSGETDIGFLLARDSDGGYVLFDDVVMNCFGEPAIYTGKDRSEVHVINSKLMNSFNSLVRITGSSSTVDNCDFIMDIDQMPDNFVDVESGGNSLRRAIWTFSSDGPNNDDPVRGGPTIENCEFYVGQNITSNGGDPGTNGIIRIDDAVEGMTVRDSNLEIKAPSIGDFSHIIMADAEKPGVSNPGHTFENINIIGDVGNGVNAFDIEDHDGTTISNCCVDLPNNINGVVSGGVNTSPTHTIQDSNIAVGGDRFDTDGGATQSLSNNTQNTGVCDWTSSTSPGSNTGTVLRTGAGTSYSNPRLGDGRQINEIRDGAGTVYWSRSTTTVASQLYMLGTATDTLTEYELSSAYDVTTATVSDSLNLSSEDSNPASAVFNDDGSKLYMLGSSTASVYEYALSTPYYIPSASQVRSFDVSTEDSVPIGIAWSTTGDSLFMVGSDSDAIYKYSMPTPFEASSGSVAQTFDISGEDTLPRNIAFNNDGTAIFLIGTGSDSIHKYSLSSAFDLSSPTLAQSLNVSSQDGNPRGFAFQPDGTKLFVVGDNSDTVTSISLSTAFDLTTGTTENSLDVSGQDTSPQSIMWDDAPQY